MLITTSPRYEWDSGYRIKIPRVLMFDRLTIDHRIITGPVAGIVRHRELPIPLIRMPDVDVDDHDYGSYLPSQNVGLIYEVRYLADGIEAYAWSPDGDLDGLYPAADLAADYVLGDRTPKPGEGLPSPDFTVMRFDEWSLAAVTLHPEHALGWCAPWPEIGPVESEPWDKRMAPWR